MTVDGAPRRWDPLGELPTRHLLQIWNGTLAVLHGLSLIGVAMRGDWTSAHYAIASTAAFGAVALVRLGAPGLLVLAAWFVWWVNRLWLHPFFDSYLAGLLLISVYVLARSIATCQREGFDALRPGPVLATEEWPETKSLSRRERRLVLARAARRIPRGEALRRVRGELSLGGIVLAISLLEIWLMPDSNPSSNLVDLPRSSHLTLAISPLLGAAATHRLTQPIRALLTREVLPEFWQQPWLWDRARREAVKGRTA